MILYYVAVCGQLFLFHNELGQLADTVEDLKNVVAAQQNEIQKLKDKVGVLQGIFEH